jgi:hypothetical protein
VRALAVFVCGRTDVGEEEDEAEGAEVEGSTAWTWLR